MGDILDLDLGAELKELEYELAMEKLTDQSKFFKMVTGKEPYDYQESFLRNTANRIAVRAGRQIGKCLWEEEFVYTPSGIVKADEINDKQSTLGGSTAELTKFKDQAYEVTLSNGEKIVVNGSHPFYCISNPRRKTETPKFRSVIEMMSKDQNYILLTDASNYKFNQVSIGKEWAKLLGYLFSDGYWSKGQSLKFTNNNEDFLEEVRSIWDDMGAYTSKRKKNDGYDLYLKEYENVGDNIFSSDARGIRVEKCSWRAKFEELGITDKDTLGELQSLTKNELKEFIRGFFNGDGYLWYRERANRISRIEIGFSVGNSERIARELQFILWRLGIYSGIKSEMMEGGIGEFYRVLVSQRNEVSKLIEILDDKKYPDKFSKAKNLIREENLAYKRYLDTNEGRWVKVREIEELGKKTMVGWETLPTHQIISYLGMETHNSTAVAIKALQRVYVNPGEEILILAPTQRQSSNVFWLIKDWVSEHQFLRDAVTRETMTEMRFDNNSLIKCLPAGRTGKNIRGYSPTMVIVDEAAFVPDEVYESIEPSLAVTEGQLILISTPRGRSGRFWRAFKPKLADVQDEEEYESFQLYHIPCTRCPNISDEFLKDKKESLPDIVYRQEYMGEFIDESNRPFPMNLIRKCTEDIPKLGEGRPGVEYYLGADFARYGRDETVIMVGELDVTAQEPTMRVVRIISMNNKSVTESADRIKTLAENFDFKAMYLDSSSMGAGVADILVDEGFPIHECDFHISSKQDYYEHLQVIMEKQRVAIPDDKKLINQLFGLRAEEKATGVSYSAPEKGHDDHPDALAILVQDVPVTGDYYEQTSMEDEAIFRSF